MISKMKNITFMAAVAATFIAFSCRGTLGTDNPSGTVRLTVDLPGLVDCETRVTGQTESSETAISNCQVFVFRTDNGMLDACSYEASLQKNGQYSVSLDCTVGERRIYAVVNAPADYTSTIRDEAALKALTTDLKDNAPNALLMIGSATSTLTEGACGVSVSVKRAAASIILQKISVDMDAPAYRGAGLFTVERIYLLNVCGRTNLALDMQPSDVPAEFWYSKLQEETDSEKKKLIADDLATALTINNGDSSDVQYSFYAYPNNCPHSVSSTFTPRATLLVVEARLDGEKYYYPFQFDSLRSNSRYIITNMTVHRPGSSSPYEPVLFSAASANVTVAGWEDGASRNVEI